MNGNNNRPEFTKTQALLLAIMAIKDAGVSAPDVWEWQQAEKHLRSMLKAERESQNGKTV